MPRQSIQAHSDKNTVYYDGSCPMCAKLVCAIGKSSRKARFETNDLTTAQLPVNVTEAEAAKGIHVVDSAGNVHRNGEAILHILEEYPRWKWLARIGRLPVLRQAVDTGYATVAANRHFLFGPASRIFWLKAVVVSGLLAGLALSARLWTSGRTFPHAPVFEGLPSLPAPVETMLFVFLLGTLAAILVMPKPQRLIFAALSVAAILALFDQLRWQPWFYQYCFILAAIGLFSWDYRDVEGQRNLLGTARLIVVSIYVFSGWQKLNPIFVSEMFPWMTEPLVQLLPVGLRSWSYALGMAAPFLEIGIGIGLLTKRFRVHAMILAFLMHIFILFCLGPLGHGWNAVVWPWNVAMPLLVLVLFWDAEGISFKETLWTNDSSFQKLVFALFAVMPFFSFFGFWDSYLSAALYSGNTAPARITISDSVARELPEEARRHLSPLDSRRHELDFYLWAVDELHVPPYPEVRVYKAITRDICRLAARKDEVSLVTQRRGVNFGEGRIETYDCSDI